MRRWLALAAALVVVALVVWALLPDAGSNRKPAAAPTRSDSSVPSGPTSGLTSCSGCGAVTTGFNAAANDVWNPSRKTGGTLRLLAGGDCDSWDPGRTSYGWCWNLQRLITRTLVGYTKVNGTNFRLGPDLATALGRHNADYTRWTYTLKPGLTYENGKPITPMDVKYGVERLFGETLEPGDPRSAITDSLGHPRGYSGPHASGDLNTITTTGDTITFRLSAPNPDFDYLMAMPATAPVPYGRAAVASGPYEIRSYRANRSVEFVRNPHWRQSTDTIRHPLVDSIRVRIDSDLEDLDRQLQAGVADARADGGVQPGFRDRLLTTERLKESADDPLVAGVTRYFAIPPSVIPNIACRRAIFYAVDKDAAVRVFGGPSAAIPARSLTPPGVAGFDPSLDPFPSGPLATGEVGRARAELAKCGKPNGFTIRYAYGSPSETAPDLFLAERRALARVGIKIVSAPGLPHTFYCTNVSAPELRDENIGLLSTALNAAYPTGLGYYGRAHARFPCLEDNDTDVRALRNPIVDTILTAAARRRATESDWRTLDRVVMAYAEHLPLIWEKTLYYRNPRLTNVTCDNAIASGIYDFVNAGVR